MERQARLCQAARIAPLVVVGHRQGRREVGVVARPVIVDRVRLQIVASTPGVQHGGLQRHVGPVGAHHLLMPLRVLFAAHVEGRVGHGGVRGGRRMAHHVYTAAVDLVRRVNHHRVLLRMPMAHDIDPARGCHGESRLCGFGGGHSPRFEAGGVELADRAVHVAAIGSGVLGVRHRRCHRQHVSGALDRPLVGIGRRRVHRVRRDLGV
mmetsp:Transcript_36608/g.121234  ORF Transcript_36608/g.121234 Transcript_36608/m.121234 type:complete len:208 (+) Transcript_36608:471-1094(+)